ncbi:hypothetical protein EQG49_11695 [Periweissella cryptocerci]|uniref:Uncharacterized protein n=1 Tax=Periweissella cryptocerci TaxID=2506420 RepID=A0A4P6YW15_9LACO|nr:hypothetical protein [Periweissella cryptocerci]QBO37069.1 hypothetical protein EQG49_11695 [Periweissella cryptocerci]
MIYLVVLIAILAVLIGAVVYSIKRKDARTLSLVVGFVVGNFTRNIFHANVWDNNIAQIAVFVVVFWAVSVLVEKFLPATWRKGPKRDR